MAKLEQQKIVEDFSCLLERLHFVLYAKTRHGKDRIDVSHFCHQDGSTVHVVSRKYGRNGAVTSADFRYITALGAQYVGDTPLSFLKLYRESNNKRS